MPFIVFSIVLLVVGFPTVRAESNIAAGADEESFVRRNTKVETRLWEQFVRHENPAKAKKKFDDSLTHGLVLEILIAVIGFTLTIGIQGALRMKRVNLRPHNRAKAVKQAVGRSANSKNEDITAGSRNRTPHHADNSGRVLEEKPVVTANVRDSVTNEATCSTSVVENPTIPGHADALKTIAKAIASGKVNDVTRLLDISLESIEKNGLLPADAKVNPEALVALLRACTGARCFKEAITVYDRLERRIGPGSRQLWSLLLYIASEAAAYNRCEEFYSKIRALAPNVGPSGRDLVNIIRKHARHHDLVGLCAILDDLKGPSSYEQYDRLIRNRALAACYKEGATELAECIANSPVFSAPLDIVGFNTLITCYSRAGQYQKCFDTFDGMETNGVVPTEATFGSLMEACVGAGDMVRAKMFMNKLSSYGMFLNAQHCTILIKGMVKQKCLNEAEQLLKDMSLTADVQLDVVCFYTLLRAYTDAGDCNGAERVYSVMLDHGIRPDEYICNALIHSCTVTKMDTEYIKSILERSIVAGVQPSATTLSLVLKAFVLCKDYDAGLQLLKSTADRFGLPKAEPRLFVQFAQAAIKAGEKAKALEVHEAMVKALSANGQDGYRAASRWLLRQCERA